jgi:hypothetical protein
MSDQSEADCAAAFTKRIEAVIALQRHATAPTQRPPKSVALTPRRSFQSIVVEAIDQYLGK